MSKNKMTTLPKERITSLIFFIRGQKVMLDRDLAQLYGVETRILNQAVRRNRNRFPSDFMFQLSDKEYRILRSQFVISNTRGGRQYLPYAFTEQGVAMLSSVLKSKQAIEVNIQIMRTFTKLRQMMMDYAELQKKIEYIEKVFAKKINTHSKQIAQIFEAIKLMLIEEEKPKKKIGFRAR